LLRIIMAAEIMWNTSKTDSKKCIVKCVEMDPGKLEADVCTVSIGCVAPAATDASQGYETSKGLQILNDAYQDVCR